MTRGRRRRGLPRGAEHDSSPFRDKSLRRGEPETTAAPSYEEHPVMQSEMHATNP
jgi:hypothetical protein